MTRSRLLTRTFPLIVLVFIVGVTAVDRVEAHALLVRSAPAQDSRLFEPPVSVIGWFSEPLEPGISSLKVVDASGQRVDSGETQFEPSDQTRMSVSLQENIGPGFYLVTWETLSRIDGHFRFGSFQFAVLNPDGSLPPGGAFSDVGGRGGDGIDLDRSLVKALSLMGQVGLVGALGFYLLVARPTVARQQAESASLASATMRHLWSAALVSIALLAVAGIAELAVQLGETPVRNGLDKVLATAWGERWAQRQAVLLATAALVGLARADGRGSLLWPALAGAVVYQALTASASHGAAIERGSFWATGLDFVHLLTGAVWIGGLVQLGRVLFWSRSGLDELARSPFVAEALRRFSLLAATAVVPLLATGILNSFVQVPRLSSLVDTDYGIVLTTKLIVVVLLLAVAGVNAFVLRPSVIKAAGAGESSARFSPLLARLVAIEAALGISVLLATAFLTQLTTARALAQIAGDTAFAAGSDFANPWVASGWTLFIATVLLALGVLGVLWTRELGGCLGWTVRNLSRVSVGVPLVILAVLTVDAAMPSGGEPDTTGMVDDGTRQMRQFEPQLSLLLQAGQDRFVSLQAEPFQAGDNAFRATVLNRALKPVPAGSLVLRFSRLEQGGVPDEVEASLDAASGSYFADFFLDATGWWAIEAVVEGEQPVTFYVRLDEPSRAPNSFAPPQYASDPQAEELFERAMATYQGLSSVTWAEELTSGSEKPSGYGLWFVTVGEAVAPDQLHFRVLNQEGLRSERYYAGSTACSLTEDEAFECSEANFRPDVFELDYLQPTAFKLGREDIVDGEITQVILFYNPNQQAWYAWWVSEESGLLRHQAMVATGHFMLTRFKEHNAALTIELPEQAPP